MSSDDIGVLSLDGEPLHIPYRHYLPEPGHAAIATLSPTQRVALACIYTRHYNGYVREAALRTIVRATDDWTPPFIVQLVGEYVIEIVEIILANVERLDTPAFRRFVVQNPTFLAKTRRRAISYWSCYHRRTSATKEGYAGIRVLDALARMASA